MCQKSSYVAFYKKGNILEISIFLKNKNFTSDSIYLNLVSLSFCETLKTGDLQGQDKTTGRCSLTHPFEGKGIWKWHWHRMTFEIMACDSVGTFSVKLVICKVKRIHS